VDTDDATTIYDGTARGLEEIRDRAAAMARGRAAGGYSVLMFRIGVPGLRSATCPLDYGAAAVEAVEAEGWQLDDMTAYGTDTWGVTGMLVLLFRRLVSGQGSRQP
jgi:hypothetical protein